MIGLCPPLYIDIIIVIAGRSHTNLIKFGISKHSCNRFGTTARMPINAYTGYINKGVARSQAFNSMLIISNSIITQVSIAESIKTFIAYGRTSARLNVDDNKTQFGQTLITVIVNGKCSGYLVGLWTGINVGYNRVFFVGCKV